MKKIWILLGILLISLIMVGAGLVNKKTDKDDCPGISGKEVRKILRT